MAPTLLNEIEETTNRFKPMSFLNFLLTFNKTVFNKNYESVTYLKKCTNL